VGYKSFAPDGAFGRYIVGQSFVGMREVESEKPLDFERLFLWFVFLQFAF